MVEKVIDVSKCEELARKLIVKIGNDPEFALLSNYDFEAVLAFAISLNAYAAGKLKGGT